MRTPCTFLRMTRARAFLEPAEQAILSGIAALADSNPFLAERVESERQALGSTFKKTTTTWHADAALDGLNPNVALLAALFDELAPKLRDRLANGARAERRELAQYEALAVYLLFHRCEAHLYELIEAEAKSTA